MTSEFNSIYTAYVAAVFVLFGCWITKAVSLSDLTVFAVIESAVLWTIFRLLYLFMISGETTQLFAAVFLVAVFGGVVYFFMPPFIRDILSSFVAAAFASPTKKKSGLNIEEILKAGLPSE